MSTPDGLTRYERLKASPKAYAAHLAYGKKVRATEEWKAQNRRRQREWKARNRLKHNAIQRALAAKWRREKPEVIKAQQRRQYERKRSTPEGRATIKADAARTYARRLARIEHMRLTDPAAHAAYMDAMRARRKVTSTSRRERAPLLAYPYLSADRSPMLASVWKLIGTRAHPEVRGDLCQDIIADICAGLTTLEQLADPKALRPYITRAHKGLSDPHVYSLDAVIPGTDGLRRIDTIEAGRSFADATNYKPGRARHANRGR